MVKRNEEWHLHNTRKKDIELLKEMGFTSKEKYSRV